MPLPMKSRPCIRILLIWASPTNLEPLRLGEEERIIRECLQKLDYPFEIDTLPACQIADLHGRLTKNVYHIIHFSGHTDRTSKLIPTVLEKYFRSMKLPWPPVGGFKIDDRFAAAVNALIDSVEADMCNSSRVCGLRSLFESLKPADNDSSFRSADVTSSTTVFPFSDPVHKTMTMDSEPFTPKLQFAPLLEAAEKKYELIFKGLLLKSGGEEHLVDVHESFSYKDLLSIGVGALCIHNDTAASYARVNAVEFVRCLVKHQSQLRCVVLNACSSIFTGYLLKQFVPITVCVSGKLTDVESYHLSKGFYESLSQGKSFARAFAECKTYFNLMNFAPGTPRRSSVDVPSANIVRMLVNSRLAAKHTCWSLRTLLMSSTAAAAAALALSSKSSLTSNALTTLATFGVSDSSSASSSLPERLIQLQMEVDTLKAENAALNEEKLQMSRTIAEGTSYLQNLLKEMARLQGMVTDLTAVGAQAILQMKTGSGNTPRNSGKLQLPMAFATVAGAAGNSGKSSSSSSASARTSRLAVAKAVNISKSRGSGGVSSSSASSTASTSVAGAGGKKASAIAALRAKSMKAPSTASPPSRTSSGSGAVSGAGAGPIVDKDASPVAEAQAMSMSDEKKKSKALLQSKSSLSISASEDLSLPAPGPPPSPSPALGKLTKRSWSATSGRMIKPAVEPATSSGVTTTSQVQAALVSPRYGTTISNGNANLVSNSGSRGFFSAAWGSGSPSSSLDVGPAVTSTVVVVAVAQPVADRAFGEEGLQSSQDIINQNQSTQSNQSSVVVAVASAEGTGKRNQSPASPQRQPSSASSTCQLSPRRSTASAAVDKADRFIDRLLSEKPAPLTDRLLQQQQQQQQGSEHRSEKRDSKGAIVGVLLNYSPPKARPATNIKRISKSLSASSTSASTASPSETPATQVQIQGHPTATVVAVTPQSSISSSNQVSSSLSAMRASISKQASPPSAGSPSVVVSSVSSSQQQQQLNNQQSGGVANQSSSQSQSQNQSQNQNVAPNHTHAHAHAHVQAHHSTTTHGHGHGHSTQQSRIPLSEVIANGRRAKQQALTNKTNNGATTNKPTSSFGSSVRRFDTTKQEMKDTF